MKINFEIYKENCPAAGESESEEQVICKISKTHESDKYLVCAAQICAPFHFIQVYSQKNDLDMSPN